MSNKASILQELPTMPSKTSKSKDKSHDAIANMEARLAKVELAMADTREGVELIDQGMEKGLKDLREHIQDLREEVLGSQVQPVSHEKFMSFQDKVMSMLLAWSQRVEALVARMKARDQEAPRVEVPKPHTFNGKRDAKELDNFLWHMECYFEAIALMDEATKDAFKREIKRQFYPENVAYLARKNMKHLKHTGLIHEYVKEFYTLMLEISNMSQEELLFNLMDNLQSWTEQELRRRGVQDLATTMARVESLTDYKRGDSSKIESLENSHATGG
ncbi:hypothetical protein CK203_053159 [Vitis vinifera]|uniref:Retrotransposon gag domain-containing protein n=1 Tax=Vitis vinifera TaxID=29760 RepID=A0A438GP48_VITVI|nr:hypothetical protein CK203_053159 [Vitis vinifera]